jgi:hypothetical protein
LSFFSYAPFIPAINVFQIDYSNLLGGANTIATIIDALVDTILMRPLLSEDRTILIDWLVTESGTGENDILPPGVPEQVAPVVAAVLISSAYFQLR